MRVIFSILLFCITACTKGQLAVLGVQVPSTNIAVEGVVFDNGYYNIGAFPETKGDTIVSVNKYAGSHADGGPLVMHWSVNGGASWTSIVILVNGVPINNCGALTFCITVTGRLSLGYQDATGASVNYAYNDKIDANFTFSNTVTAPAGYTINFSPVKMKQMPSGKIRCGVYYYPSSSSLFKIGFVNSTNNGASFSTGEEIYSGSSTYPTNPGDWQVHEFGFEIIENTGSDATCKMIAIARVNLSGENGGYYLLLKTGDGGATWTTDVATTDPGSFIDDNGVTQSGPFGRSTFYAFLGSNSPVDIKLHNGFVYVANGERNITNGYKLKYTRATVTGAYRNKFDDWERPTTVMTLNSSTMGGSIDGGYPVMFIPPSGGLWCQIYDVSTQPRNPLITDDRCWIFQKKLHD
jgi:hypothetical protein